MSDTVLYSSVEGGMRGVLAHIPPLFWLKRVGCEPPPPLQDSGGGWDMRLGLHPTIISSLEGGMQGTPLSKVQ